MRRSTPEHERMAELASGTKRWHQWGPYVGDRQWGTVREDYSPDGEAWRYFPMTRLAAAPIVGARMA